VAVFEYEYRFTEYEYGVSFFRGGRFFVFFVLVLDFDSNRRELPPAGGCPGWVGRMARGRRVVSGQGASSGQWSVVGGQWAVGSLVHAKPRSREGKCKG